MNLSRELIQLFHDKDHSATTVLLAARWLQTHPGDTRVMLSYASMLYQMTRYEEAIRVYEALLDKIPVDDRGRWIVLSDIGRAYRYWGRLAVAETWFKKAIEVDPEPVGSYIMLGACQARQGKLKEAEESHRAAARFAGSKLLDEAYHNLGLVLRGQDRWAEAAECFRKAIEITPDYSDAIEALDDVETAIAVSTMLD